MAYFRFPEVVPLRSVESGRGGHVEEENTALDANAGDFPHMAPQKMYQQGFTVFHFPHVNLWCSEWLFHGLEWGSLVLYIIEKLGYGLVSEYPWLRYAPMYSKLSLHEMQRDHQICFSHSKVAFEHQNKPKMINALHRPIVCLYSKRENIKVAMNPRFSMYCWLQ